MRNAKRHSNTLSLVLLSAALLPVMWSCKDLTGSDELADRTAPTLLLAKGTSTADSLLTFNVNVTDNLGIKRIQINAIGGITAQYDSVFTSAVTSTALSLSLAIPPSVAPGTPVTLIGTAYDGAGNKSLPDTLRVATGNLTPADARITSPASGATAIIGKSVIISISGSSKLRIRSLGFSTNNAAIPADSTIFNSPLLDTVALLDTIAIPTSMQPGSLIVIPFLRDSIGNRMEGSPITLRVQSATNSVAPPTVFFSSDKRVELTDTVFVSAQDTTGSGIRNLGLEIRQLPNGAPIIDSVFLSDVRFTTQQHTFSLALPTALFNTFPQTIYIKAYAITGNGTRGYAKLANGMERVDTLTVVAGATRRLPNGGSIADAIYHANKDRLYLTNIDRNQLEVFDLDNTKFLTPISVGSRPWGITVWPRSRTGTAGDTLLIANSGGTSISYVNLNAAIFGSPEGREVYRYPLPNIVAYTVTTKLSEEGVGAIKVRTQYDFSDRPQYIAATCKTPTLAVNGCSEVVLVYSTTPTPGQSIPFPNRGTLRYENLTTKQSHFFFEQAIGQSSGRSDTLEIVRKGAGCVDQLDGTRLCVGAEEAMLVPSEQYAYTATGDSVLVSVVVQIENLAFRDTTFVRSSGNFKRAIFGEGGNAYGSRAIAYDAMRNLDSMVTLPNGSKARLSIPVIDRGISPPTDVTDFVANAYSRIKGVGINFDGELSAIRADSVYILDQGLRLLGLVQTPSSTNAGFDFHPGNSGNGISTPLNACYLFTASSEPVIEVYENNHYRLVMQIPIKTPIIGPIKSATRRNTGQLVLTGATARGIIAITLPDSYRAMMSACPNT